MQYILEYIIEYYFKMNKKLLLLEINKIIYKIIIMNKKYTK